jgi:hypothetical protein
MSEPFRVAEGYAIPGLDVSCMDAAEMLVDGFIKDARLWPDPEDRNELVRRLGTLLAMQREALKGEYNDLLQVARIEQELHMLGFTKATAKRLGPGAEEAYLSGGAPGLNNWRRDKREAAIKKAEARV